jgi:D-lactate dehydrogenase
MQYITFVLPNGLIFNTEKPNDYIRFEKEATNIAEGLKILRGSLLGNTALVERIRKKYKQKNTVGYGLNAFVDYEHPLDILAHLLIGGEGTLAFIAEAVMHTVPDLPYKMTGMLYFDSPEAAGEAIPSLKNTGAEALEFMDRASLRSVEDMKGLPDFFKNLPARAAAILCEFQENTEGGVIEKYQKAVSVFDTLPLLFAPNFTQNVDEQALMWKMRKGMYPTVAGMRAKGTSALLEDFTFPVERLGEAITDVQILFEKYGYDNGIIFGHAKDGNLHFCISQSFATEKDVLHYENFNEDLFDLVLNKYDGALKAEHSTGRAVAPYVEAEWGSDAYDIMKKLKKLIDPENLLNPDVIITTDKKAHVHNLKVMPIVEEEVDRCIECGFCEKRCPSRDLTLTPRRRIGVRRAIKRLENQGDTATKDALLKEYQYDGMDTCAVDGMCALDCPVDINTGDLIKRLRRENHSPSANKMALRLAKNFGLLETSTRFALKSGFLMNDFLGKNAVLNVTKTMKKVVSGMPLWSNYISKPARSSDLTTIKKLSNSDMQILYFPTCISRMMGGDIVETFINVCKKANIQVHIPDSIKGTCCGQIFSSKGFTDAFKFTANQTIEKLWKNTEGGGISIVMDVTSCTQNLKNCRNYLTEENQKRFDSLQILDSIDFAADILLPRLTIKNKKDNIVFHPVCSVYKMGLMGKLQAIGKACAIKADIPTFAGCCGMAGDRGFYYPNLINAATQIESDEVKQNDYQGYYSSAKTCEMSLSEAVGKNYESILKLLDEVSN